MWDATILESYSFMPNCSQTILESKVRDVTESEHRAAWDYDVMGGMANIS